MKNLYHIAVLSLLLLSGSIVAQHENGRIVRCAEELLANQADRPQRGDLVLNAMYQLLEGLDDEGVFLFQLEPRGFIIITDYHGESRVAGYSFEENFPDPGDLPGLPVQAIVTGISNAHKHGVRFTVPVLKSSAEEPGNGPFVETMWGQVNCKDEANRTVNVTNLFTPSHYAAGCVAISMATVLHYYQWPTVGTGETEYSDNYGSSTGSYWADFGNTAYDFGTMRNVYNHVNSLQAERDAAGELAFHAAVALGMDFEHDGSTSNVNKIPGASTEHFRYYGFYKDVGSTIFWDRLDKNMGEGIPAILAIEAGNGAGHSIVCDGLNYSNQTPYYHLNMGWWGAGNGWFTIRDSWNSGGYDQVIGAVLDMVPVPWMHEVEELAGDQVKLSWSVAKWPVAEAFEVQQKAGDGNWATIGQVAPDSTMVVDSLNPEINYAFRIRAQMNGEWYTGSWSNEVQYGNVADLPGFYDQNTELVVYPNPVSDLLFVRVPEGTSGYEVIEVADITGKTILREHVNPGQQLHEIYTGSLPAGIYFIKIRVNGTGLVHKILKH
ncbi:MAG: C10 family peptidase [Bacteroidota bacterium]